LLHTSSDGAWLRNVTLRENVTLRTGGPSREHELKARCVDGSATFTMATSNTTISWARARTYPLQAGFAFLPTAIGVVIGAATTSRLIGRVGPRPPMMVGSVLVAIGLFWLARITVHSTYLGDVLGPLVVLALGLGQIFVSTSSAAISDIRSSESGLASALLNVWRQLGGSLGIAAMGLSRPP
jgi:MFS family permease